MKRFALIAAAVAVSGSLFSATASAQFAKADDAIKYRQSAFTLMTTHMGRLGAMARGDVPFDAATAQASAQVIAVVSALPWDAFPPGSNTGVKRHPPLRVKTTPTFARCRFGMRFRSFALRGPVRDRAAGSCAP